MCLVTLLVSVASLGFHRASISDTGKVRLGEPPLEAIGRQKKRVFTFLPFFNALRGGGAY